MRSIIALSCYPQYRGKLVKTSLLNTPRLYNFLLQSQPSATRVTLLESISDVARRPLETQKAD